MLGMGDSGSILQRSIFSNQKIDLLNRFFASQIFIGSILYPQNRRSDSFIFIYLSVRPIVSWPRRTFFIFIAPIIFSFVPQTASQSRRKRNLSSKCLLPKLRNEIDLFFSLLLLEREVRNILWHQSCMCREPSDWLASFLARGETIVYSTMTA